MTLCCKLAGGGDGYGGERAQVLQKGGLVISRL